MHTKHSTELNAELTEQDLKLNTEQSLQLRIYRTRSKAQYTPNRERNWKPTDQDLKLSWHFAESGVENLLNTI